MACSTSCPVGQMLCGEGRCLEQRFVCDGNNDCGQGEDEVMKMIKKKIKIKRNIKLKMKIKIKMTSTKF